MNIVINVPIRNLSSKNMYWYLLLKSCVDINTDPRINSHSVHTKEGVSENFYI